MAHWLADDRIDAWVPGSANTALECQAAVQLAMRDGHRREFDEWLGAFASGTSTPLAPKAPNQIGLSGGCVALADPNLAYSWSSELAPLLKLQMKHYREGKAPIPLGRFADHPVVAVCALQDDAINHCRALDLPLYSHLHYPPRHLPRYSFPSDVPVVDVGTQSCPSYRLPRVGPGPG